ncbi:MAG TPA: DUF433 domain-containing protein [Phycisphaerae bacterium]|jgi:uncharacterized protein (DUF433 family)
MELNDYFEFVSPDEIRLKGHRVWIEHILYDYVKLGKTPEEIAVNLPTLRLDQVYATILYYLTNREAIDRYLEEWIEHGERLRREQQQNLPPHLVNLRQRLQQRLAERQKQSA